MVAGSKVNFRVNCRTFGSLGSLSLTGAIRFGALEMGMASGLRFISNSISLSGEMPGRSSGKTSG